MLVVLANFAAFQVGWFSSVLGAAAGMPWIGPLVFLGVLALHLRLARIPFNELGLVIACGIVGLWYDSLLVTFGWVSYPAGQWHATLAPYWIVTMWMLFGTTLNASLGWLRNRPALAIVLGGIAGPLSYLAGEKLGAMSFDNFEAAIFALTVGWALMLPLLTRLATELNGMDPNQEHATS